METSAIRRLVLESLSDVADPITPEAVGFYKQQCMVCFHRNGHRSGVNLRVVCEEGNDTFQVCWTGKVTQRMLRAYVDHNKLVDFGACAIALLLVPELTGLSAIKSSAVGTGIDYYLAPKDQEDDLLFNYAARLEVSGILTENSQNTVEARIKRKIRRLDRVRQKDFSEQTPVFIVVVEFGQPWSEMVKR